MKCIIWDLDNCVSNDDWRIRLIDHSLEGGARWAAYHAACGADKPVNLDVFDAMRELHFDATPVFITGRPESVRETTRAWIRRHLHVHDPEIMMRGGDLVENSVALKRRHALALKGRGALPILAFDDRQDMVEMYRSIGIRAVVLRAHEDMSPHGDIQATNERPLFAPLRHAAAEAIAPGKPEDWADVDSLADLRPRKIAPTWPFAGPASGKAPVKRVSAEDVLREMAELFNTRNSGYKDNFKMVGPIMKALFPDGPRPELVLDDRWHLFELAVVKLTRFAISELTHSDSARDAAVYLAMIEAINKERAAQ